jgi:hypothetical protein
MGLTALLTMMVLLGFVGDMMPRNGKQFPLLGTLFSFDVCNI